jgi:hypothetical protein
LTRQDPEAALFAGLIHEFGALYLISRANDYPALLANELAPMLSPFDSMPVSRPRWTWSSARKPWLRSWPNRPENWPR